MPEGGGACMCLRLPDPVSASATHPQDSSLCMCLRLPDRLEQSYADLNKNRAHAIGTACQETTNVACMCLKHQGICTNYA